MFLQKVYKHIEKEAVSDGSKRYTILKILLFRINYLPSVNIIGTFQTGILLVMEVVFLNIIALLCI